MTTTHRWTFFRAGNLDQVVLKTADDFRHLNELNQQLWVALACPTSGLECDNRTLALIDGDKDSRVRVPELLEAVRWTCSLLKDPSELVHRRDGLLTSALVDNTPEGKLLIASAQRVLSNLQRPLDSAITVADMSDASAIFANTRFNGDGVITPESSDDDALKRTIADIITIQSPVIDRNGKPGVDQTSADAFFTACRNFDTWSSGSNASLPLDDATPVAFQSLLAVRDKIDEYFARCRVTAYDARAAEAINQAEKEFLGTAAKDLAITVDEFTGMPLQAIAAGKPLQLAEEINPAWSDRISAFTQQLFQPLLSKDTITLSEPVWRDILARFAPYEAWITGKQGQTVEVLGLPRVRALLADNMQGKINELIIQDLAVKDEVAGFEQVERLTRYQRDLFMILENFTNFSKFYNKNDWANFQAGTLYLDQRACKLCIQVKDPATHMALGALAKMYIAYCTCTRGSEKMHIAACITQGDGDFLMVGRNGIFYDRQGRDWDATIVKIIDNPVSIRQAFFSPYKKLVRFIEEQVTKRAAAAEQSSEKNLQTAATASADTAQSGKAAPASKSTIDIGTVAALGVGVGALGTILGGFIAGFIGLGWWMPLGIFGIMLLISLPSVIIAAIKLRQRTLGPVLEGTGWAINGRITISQPLARALTDMRKFPAGTRHVLNDPYKEKNGWAQFWLILTFLIIVTTALAWWQWPAIVSYWQHLTAPNNSEIIPPATSSPQTATATPTPTPTPTPPPGPVP